MRETTGKNLQFRYQRRERKIPRFGHCADYSPFDALFAIRGGVEMDNSVDGDALEQHFPSKHDVGSPSRSRLGDVDLDVCLLNIDVVETQSIVNQITLQHHSS